MTTAEGIVVTIGVGVVVILYARIEQWHCAECGETVPLQGERRTLSKDGQAHCAQCGARVAFLGTNRDYWGHRAGERSDWTSVPYREEDDQDGDDDPDAPPSGVGCIELAEEMAERRGAEA